jgi:hypothetical protein
VTHAPCTSISTRRRHHFPGRQACTTQFRAPQAGRRRDVSLVEQPFDQRALVVVNTATEMTKRTSAPSLSEEVLGDRRVPSGLSSSRRAPRGRRLIQ